jgi:hypothetical protein
MPPRIGSTEQQARYKEVHQMASFGCAQTVNVLNFLFDPRVIKNERTEILAKLNAGDSLSSVLLSLGSKFQRFQRSSRLTEIESVVNGWPARHLEAIRALVIWSLSSQDTDEPVRLRWKGDADYHETVTKFEIREDEVVIEFAHPPVAARLSA